MKKPFEFLLRAIVLFASIVPLNASVAEQQSPALPGHSEKIDKMVDSVSDIVVGRFVSLGGIDGDGMGTVPEYQGAEVDVATPLKGSKSGRIEVIYRVSFLKGREESSPVIGVQYIMFIKDYSSRTLVARKLIPATDANIATVKAMIAK